MKKPTRTIAIEGIITESDIIEEIEIKQKYYYTCRDIDIIKEGASVTNMSQKDKIELGFPNGWGLLDKDLY